MTVTANPDVEITQEVTYIALQRLKVGMTADGKPIFREPGEEIPEVHNWPYATQFSYAANHRIEKTTKLTERPIKRGPGRPRTKD